MVHSPLSPAQRQISRYTSGGHDDHIRHTDCGLGSYLPEQVCRWPLEQRREESTHQLSGAQGSILSLKVLCREQIAYTYPAVDRQHHSDFIHKPQRWYPLPFCIDSGKEPLVQLPLCQPQLFPGFPVCTHIVYSRNVLCQNCDTPLDTPCPNLKSQI